uniref:Dual specificity protein phosphatase n=1 Tax=Lates calcarifer TaxID=8187 RepID=A0A4W6DWJ6_LATCA
MSGSNQRQDLVLIKELELILDSCALELTPVDEVWPNLYIGNVAVAQNRKTLHKLGITHVLNVAHSKQGSIGDQSFYGNTCVYLGIPAEDSDHFDLSQYFKPAADFIHKALKSKDGNVYECDKHCPVKVLPFLSSLTFFILLYRETAGALHYGRESISHFGPGVLDVVAASPSERCSEACHPKTSHLPQPELPVPPPQAG